MEWDTEYQEENHENKNKVWCKLCTAEEVKKEQMDAKE